MTANTIIMKRNTLKYLIVILLAFLVLLVTLFVFQWNEKGNTVYQENAEVIYQGSVYYNYEKCGQCHGINYDGQGPNAESIRNDYNIVVPGFDGETKSKTHLDFFKAITLGTESFPDHTYLNYTDQGRWAMAYFLYSLEKMPKKEDERRELQENIAQANREIKKLYQKNDRMADLEYQKDLKRMNDKSQIPLIKKVVE